VGSGVKSLAAQHAEHERQLAATVHPLLDDVIEELVVA
jgi:hypothetical protein